MTSAGSSKAWVTAFVAHALAQESSQLKPLLPEIIKGIKKQSYNDTIPLDADSLQFFLIASNKIGTPISADFWNCFLDHQQADGGFSTYGDEEALRKRLSLQHNHDVSGWLSSQICVSAVAAYILFYHEHSPEQFKKLINYLIKNQSSNGSWKSYWWSSDVYATSWSVMSLYQAEIHNENALRGQNWLVTHQHQEGYWVDDVKKEKSCFFTALALQGLMAGSPEIIIRNQNAISKGVSWLLSQQTQDGSWPSSRILAIPAPNIKNREEVMYWRKSSLGVNVVVDDHMRIFTTAAVIKTLVMFKKLFYERG